jgi:hypothetical protein
MGNHESLASRKEAPERLSDTTPAYAQEPELALLALQ